MANQNPDLPRIVPPHELDAFPASLILDKDDGSAEPEEPSPRQQQPECDHGYLVPWAPRLQVDQDDIRSNTAQGTSSHAPSTIVIQDRGDSDHLSRNPERSSTFDTITSDTEQHPPTNQPQSPGVDNTVSQPLGQCLRAALVPSAARERDYFLPLNDLDQFVTCDSIQRELERNNVSSSIELAQRIWVAESVSGTTKTSRRKLFAIMVLIDKLEYMPKLIAEGLFDCHLPFEMDKSNEGLPVLATGSESGKLRRLAFCKDWGTINHENFFDAQWQINAPFLKLSYVRAEEDGPREGKRHLILRERDVLPIQHWERISHGDFGDVFKVRFHPDHYSLTTSKVS